MDLFKSGGDDEDMDENEHQLHFKPNYDQLGMLVKKMEPPNEKESAVVRLLQFLFYFTMLYNVYVKISFTLK